MRHHVIRLLARILPSLVYADELTESARRLLARMGVAFVALLIGIGAVGLLATSNWRGVVGVLAGAFLAWSVSLVVWTVSSYRTKREEIQTDLRRIAEIDLLHARLNHLAARLKAPTIDISAELDAVLQAREERLAHFTGLDEFREPAPKSGHDFWDSEALGSH